LYRLRELLVEDSQALELIKGQPITHSYRDYRNPLAAAILASLCKVNASRTHAYAHSHTPAHTLRTRAHNRRICTHWTVSTQHLMPSTLQVLAIAPGELQTLVSDTWTPPLTKTGTVNVSSLCDSTLYILIPLFDSSLFQISRHPLDCSGCLISIQNQPSPHTS
jgi:hypothetical protein